MPTIQKRQPRLKESCDHCSSAKVRCTKDKPNCLRCAQKGFECTYSHSRRAGRRNMNASRSSAPAPIASHHHSRTSSDASSSWSESHPSPEFSDDSNSDIFDLWNTTSAPTSVPDFPMLQHMWDEEMYGLQPSHFDQAVNYMPGAPMLPEAPMVASPTPFHAIPLQPFDDIPSDLLAAPQISRSSSQGTLSTQNSSATSSSRSSMSSVSSQHADAVHDELSNLTSFAEMMEKKFDGVVKTRLQYRDVYSEFGIPLDELENGLEGVEKKMMSAGVPGQQQQQGFVPAPDASELAFYYSLAEMKRRLRWLKEDFGKMVQQTA